MNTQTDQITCQVCGKKDILFGPDGRKGICMDCGADVAKTDPNAKIREIAETMAREAFPHSFAMIDADPVSFKAAYEHNINQFMEEAREQLEARQADMSTQTDPNAAYNAKVREVAEMLAEGNYKRSMEPVPALPIHGRVFMYPRWEELKPDQLEKIICQRLEDARAMVAEMEQEAKEAYFQCAQDFGHFTTYSDPDLKKHLIERGLIPNTKTDDNA